MIIKNKLSKRGFSVNLLKNAELNYPEGTWENLDNEKKKIIVDNLIYLKISPYSMFLGSEMYFNSSLPFLKEMGDKGVMLDIPRIAEEDKTSTKKLIEKFKNKKIKFKNNDAGLIDGISTSDSALIGMSFGKDSLLSYGVVKELNLKPKLTMVQDFWDLELHHKFDLIKKFQKEFNEKIGIVTDKIDDISSCKRINKINSEGIVGANAMNAYAIMLLPLVIYYRSKYIIFGNEQNFNDYFINAEGFKVYPSYEQSSEWMQEQNWALQQFTNNKIQITSLIEPLYNIAEVKILFNRYPKIAKYQMSCSLLNSKSKKERWCYKCPMCAKAFLYLMANNIDAKMINFNKNLFDKNYEKLYPLFNNKPERIYEKPKAVRDEQLFAFYLAYRNGKKGYLVDQFKKKFLKEAIEREDELCNKFFKIHDAVSIPNKFKESVNSIYKEELNK